RSGQADLVIAGDGPERPRLQQLAAEAGCADAVHLLGFVEDVPAVLAASDALVHASAAEGVPQVVIQALAAGAPVLATDVVGLREVPDAPVTIVRANGDGLLDAARGFVSAPRPQPVPLAALDAWRPSSVHDELARLHADVASLRSTSGATRRLSVEW
ncbi:MAG: glycosyltransferase, partial [Dehalococcoidia bacterium]